MRRIITKQEHMEIMLSTNLRHHQDFLVLWRMLESFDIDRITPMVGSISHPKDFSQERIIRGRLNERISILERI